MLTSSASDLNMYFCETYIGLETDGVVHPFFVYRVNNSRIAPKFCGVAIDFDGNHNEIEVYANDPRIVVETPEIGYIKLGRNYQWLAMNSTDRSTRKGLCSRRFGDGVRINHQEALQIYKRAAEVGSDFVQLHFHKTRDKLHYKGTEVGSLDSRNLSLNPKFKYLSRIISRLYPTLVIVEAE